ncbi:MAG: hypothetical protein QF915_04475 [Candidatus Woesearchaeota archaeon]|jgi:hypothetical protein|nr:hypothetical protein [Candidatus Woesearchaeota archaeon]MDP7458129.1 hypothetical protein [Candidatus Woesearchaeota archaeon]
MTFDPEWDEEVQQEDGIYSESERESLMEDDEISAEEEAFMRGWEDALEI